MTTYAIGDLQGCYAPLLRLLDAIAFDATVDQLWFVGDLVNRGPASLACLRFAESLGDKAVVVLGNHDLHLLAVAHGYAVPHGGDTLAEILAAPDRDELLNWLRHRPLIHRADNHLLVHAGLLPSWTGVQAIALAGEVETQLRGPDYRDFLAVMYGNKPDRWQDDLTGFDRLRVITNVCTRLRFCTPEGRMDFAAKGEASSAPAGFLPWFAVPGRRSADVRVVFGHWASLGLTIESNVIGLDTGCVWGRSLTTIRLDDGAVFQVGCDG